MANRPSREELEQMKSSGAQAPKRTEELKTMLKQFGFETSHNSNHVKISHTKYSNIKVSNLVVGSEKRINLIVAADACLEVLNIEEPVVQKPDRGEDFEAPVYTIPDDFELMTQAGNEPSYFLRHKKRPQIAVELSGYTDGDDLSEQCNYLDQRAKEFAALLYKAVNDYDFKIQEYKTGRVVLQHRAYLEDFVLDPFTIRKENFSGLELLKAKIDEAQKDREEYLKALLQLQGLEPVESNDGVRKFKFCGPFNRNKNQFDILSLPVTKNGYFSNIDLVKFLCAFNTEFWKDFKYTLLRKYGLDVTKASEDTLSITHPFFDIGGEIPDLLTRFTFVDVFEAVNDIDKQEAEMKRLDAFLDLFIKTIGQINQFLADCEKLSNQRAKEFTDLLKSMNWPLIKITNTQKTNVGKPATFYVKDEKEEVVVDVKGILFPTAEDQIKKELKYNIVLDDSSLENLREKVKSRRPETSRIFNESALCVPENPLQHPKTYENIIDGVINDLRRG